MNTFYTTITTLAAFALLKCNEVSAGKIPSYVTACKRDTEHLPQCITNAWEALRPYVGEGIPKLKIPPLEPFSLPRISVNRNSDSLDLKANLTQMSLAGLTKIIVSKLSVDLTDLSGSVSLALSDLNVTTLYDMDAMLMKIAAMKGQGKYDGTLSDVSAVVSGKAELSAENKRGDRHLRLTWLRINLTIGDAKGRLVDTSNNTENEQFAETANQFYNGYRREVLDIVSPLMEETCESLVMEVANQVLAAVPFDDMFTDDEKSQSRESI